MNEQIKALQAAPNKQTQSDSPVADTSEVQLKWQRPCTMAGISPVHHQGLNPKSFSWGMKLSEWAIPVSHHPWSPSIVSGFLQHFHLCSEGSHDCKIYVSSF
jgi:hypothetical protein